MGGLTVEFELRDLGSGAANAVLYVQRYSAVWEGDEREALHSRLFLLR